MDFFIQLWELLNFSADVHAIVDPEFDFDRFFEVIKVLREKPFILGLELRELWLRRVSIFSQAIFHLSHDANILHVRKSKNTQLEQTDGHEIFD